MVGFIIGLVIGGIIGLFTTCLYVAAHESDNVAEDEFERFKKWSEDVAVEKEDI